MKRFTGIVVILFFIVVKLSADAPKDTFRLANEAYEKGAIDDAIQLYESIVTNDYGSTSIYYNLGTAYLKKENWSAARFYLEKGIQANPNHPGLNKNLELVRTAVDDLYNFPHFPLMGLIDNIHSVAGKNIISIVLLILFIVAMAVAWFKPQFWQKGLYGIAGFWLLVFILFMLERKNARIYHNMAIIWKDETPLYDKPENDSVNDIVNLKAGVKVRSLEKVGPWCRIDLADGTSGWIEEKEVRFL
ncbi:MAG: tetratricopeptide repeat protein [Saprospiraceae bacterium]|nr:tetratricopeptide repeat protein [Saprospiraceae bacterium]